MQSTRTFVLIHGAWHAAWCWERIKKALLARGHQVLAPDLPGHGHPKYPCKAISLTDYTQCIIDLVNTLQMPVTLVGHSMGGLVISAVAQAIPDAIKELIFIAAYIPQDQQSLFSIAQNAQSNNLSPYLIIDEVAQEIRITAQPDLKNVLFNRCTNAETHYALSHLQPQPLRPFTDYVSLDKAFDRIPKRALVCLHDQALLLSDQLQMSRQATDDIVHLEADHAAYYSGLQQIIHELSKR